MSLTKLPFDVQELRREYAAGKNLMELMRRSRRQEKNDETTILYSYDLQAGSYVADLENPVMAELKSNVGRKLADLFESLGANVVCEAGVGEATTLAEVVASSSSTRQFLGFDISLSRLLYARAHLRARAGRDATLFVGALGAIPFADDAVDVVYTFHSVEPNGGREREVLTELLRVSRHYLVLVEPSNELGGPGTLARIEQHGYVKNLRRTLEEMGCNIIRFERWGLDADPNNETALTIVEKCPRAPGSTVAVPALASPLSREPLTRRADCLYSDVDGLAFPIIEGLPCLLPANAVIATRLPDFDKTHR